MGTGYEGVLWRLIVSSALGAAVAVVVTVIRTPKSPATVGLLVGAAAYLFDWYTDEKKQQ